MTPRQPPSRLVSRLVSLRSHLSRMAGLALIKSHMAWTASLWVAVSLGQRITRGVTRSITGGVRGALTRLQPRLRPRLQRFYDWLDRGPFRLLVAYTAHPLHIFLLIFLWIALILCAGWTAFELSGGNYTNGLSAIVACILLYRQIRAEARQLEQHNALTARHDAHDETLASLRAELLSALSAIAALQASGQVSAPSSAAGAADTARAADAREDPQP